MLAWSYRALLLSDNSLASGVQAEEDVSKFIEEEHSFDDYSKELLKYHKLVDEITYKSIKVRTCGRCPVWTYTF